MVDARIPCMATVFGEPEAHPVAALVARFHADLDQLGDPRLLVDERDRARRHPRLGGRAAAPVTELELRVAHQADHLDLGAEAGAADTGSLVGQPPPGRPNATPSAAWSSPTRWTTTTNRSGTRWPPARLRGTGRGDRQGRRRAAGRAPPRRRGPPDRLRRPSTTRSRCAGSRTTSSRWSPPRSPKTTSSRPCNARKHSPRKRAGSPSPTTGTACATAGSPCPAPVGAMLKQAVLAINPPQAPAALRHPQGARARVLRVRHPLPHRPAPPGRRRRRHRGGHHDPGEPARGQPDPGAVGHRGPDHRRPGPQAGLRGRDHPDGPRREVRDPRPRPPQTALRPVPADRDPAPRPALHQPSAATGPPRCATSTTTPPGAEAARPTSPTDASCAPGTTPTPTPRSTR